MRSKKHVFHWHCLEVVQKKNPYKYKHVRTHRLNLIKWWFRLWWDREAVRFHEIPPAASSRTGDWRWYYCAMVTLKRANQVPLSHSASSLSLQPTAASPFPSQHPSGGEGASPTPRLIWSWQLESRALYWPQPSPKGYIRIPTPRWTGSANRFGMSVRLAELNESTHTHKAATCRLKHSKWISNCN